MVSPIERDSSGMASLISVFLSGAASISPLKHAEQSP
jgi:hypothetical protein